MDFRQPQYSQSGLNSQTQSVELINAFMRQVYMWMAGGLLLTAGVAAYVMNTEAIIMYLLQNQMVLIGLFVVQLIAVFGLSAAIQRLNPSTAGAIFLGYAGLNGVTIAPLVFMFTQASVTSAFLSTCGMFAAMSIYGMTTKRDLTGMGSFLIMGVFGLIIATVVNMFLQSPALHYATSFIGVLIFAGLTAYDTQKIKAMGETAPDDAGVRQRGAIMGALALYLDFINMFIFLLQLFGQRR